MSWHTLHNPGISLLREPRANVRSLKHTLGLLKTYILRNTVTEIVLGENSYLEHDKLSVRKYECVSYWNSSAPDERSKSLHIKCSFAWRLPCSNNITAVLDAEDSECTLNGLTLSTGTQIIDNHTAIDHAKPHCNSHEL